MKSVIVLHGWGLSADRFAPLRIRLGKKGYRVFVPDLPGFGKAAPPSTVVDLSFYVRFLHSYIRKQAIKRPILIGHSFGGRIALKYQYTYPDDVDALIFTGTPGFTPIPRKRLTFFIAFAKVGKVISSIPPFSFFQKNIRRWYYYLVGARDYYRATGVMQGTFKKIVQEELSQYMKTIHVPCLLVWGENDRITPLWIARRMKESIKGAVLSIIPDANHGVSYKCPDVFVSVIVPFLTTI